MVGDLPSRAAHFESVIASLPSRLAELQAAPSARRANHPSIPRTAGIYLLTEGGLPIYVGQTRNLRERLRQHTIPSARENQASFAFRLAMTEAETRGLIVTGTRRDRETHVDLAALFLAAKRRVAEMDVQFIEMADPIERTIFEVYAALFLGTETHNLFETH